MIRDYTLVVGIGSPHGDDQLGWLVAGRLVAFADMERTAIRLTGSPVNLLDWIDGVRRLVICDASRGQGSVGAVRRWSWPSPELSEIAFSGTHDLSIQAVLGLAERLGRLPERVTLWGIEGAQFQAGQPLSAGTMESVLEVVRQIDNELKITHPTPVISCMSSR